MGGAPLELPPGEAHLWELDMSSPELEPRVPAYEALLTLQETAQYRRFVFESGRRQYLLTRALVRTVLSAYAPQVAPAAWRFGANAHGRPFLTGPEPLTGLSFNLSNTHGYVVCLAARGCEVGVDVEAMRPERDFVPLARRFFAPEEARALEALPEEAQMERFYRHWTLKEAYIKGRGMGLAIPLADFGFTLGEGPGIGFACAPALSDVPSRWQFFQERLGANAWVAGALARGEGQADYRIVHRPAVPLEGELRARPAP